MLFRSERFSLTQFRGKIIILNFWASWCVACRQEAKDLEKIWQTWKDKNVIVLGVAIQDQSEDALSFGRQLGKTYYLGLDDQGTSSVNYGVTGVPETFIIDKEGKVMDKEVGPIDLEKINQLLNEQTKS